jgi:ATP-dependent DNA ligase
MLWRVRNSRGRPINAPAAFIHPCQPIVAKQPPRGPGWAHELKHDGYRLQIHIRDGRVRLYTMNAADWSERYPLIVEDAAKIKGAAIIDAKRAFSRLLIDYSSRWNLCFHMASPLRRCWTGSNS